MKKLMFTLVVAIVAVSAGAAEIKVNEKMLRATGGMIVKPGTQKGEVSFVNCQSSADKAWIVECVDYLKGATRFNITLQDGAFDIRKPAMRGNVTVFIIDDPDLPALLCAPEAPWAAVNVARLKSEKPAFFSARVKKELSRALAMIGGGVHSQYKDTLLQPITKVDDLDRHVDYRLPSDVISRFAPYLNEYGVSGELRLPYKAACQQGWAPAPTNEYQKAIWDKVHEMPTKPIKITYDPVKGE